MEGGAPWGDGFALGSDEEAAGGGIGEGEGREGATPPDLTGMAESAEAS